MKFDTKDIIKNVQNILVEVFSLTNLTVSLLSALLVIGISYLSGLVSSGIQLKAYSNPIIYLIYLLVIIIAYVLAMVGPAFLTSSNKKNWPSFVYIVFLEIVWLCIFIAVLYFTTETVTIPQTMQFE